MGFGLEDVFAPVISLPLKLAKEALGYATPKLPNAPRMPKPPTPEDPDVQEAMERERLAQMRAMGRASTILTGGQGLQDSATTARRTLLGA
jgi:hypothetical protein